MRRIPNMSNAQNNYPFKKNQSLATSSNDTNDYKSPIQN